MFKNFFKCLKIFSSVKKKYFFYTLEKIYSQQKKYIHNIPFKYKFCEKSFSESGNLKTHIISIISLWKTLRLKRLKDKKLFSLKLVITILLKKQFKKHIASIYHSDMNFVATLVFKMAILQTLAIDSWKKEFFQMWTLWSCFFCKGYFEQV